MEKPLQPAGSAILKTPGLYSASYKHPVLLRPSNIKNPNIQINVALFKFMVCNKKKGAEYA